MAALSRFLTEITTSRMAEEVPSFALTTWLETAVLVNDRRAAALLVRRLAPLENDTTPSTYLKQFFISDNDAPGSLVWSAHAILPCLSSPTAKITVWPTPGELSNNRR